MRCPFCGSGDTKVVDSRAIDDNNSIRRRRECEGCKKRFSTYERYEKFDLVVIKKDHTREKFDINKIVSGILKSCEKRPVSMEIIRKSASDIEVEIRKLNQIEISSQVIGTFVMDKLKDLDKVAYVRFASVYREFKDLDSFSYEIDNLKNK